MLYNQDYTNYQLNRSNFRKFIRRIYLNHVLKYVKGKTIDFGCGIGELLSILPEGSIGLDINETSIRYCRTKGLNADVYKPEIDYFQFNCLGNNIYKTFVMVHVLEHLEGAAGIMRRISESCERLGIERIIIVLPCLKGFKYDNTHKTFINEKYIQFHSLNCLNNYAIKKQEHFPFCFSWIGDYFIYNEYIIIYDRKK